MTVKRQKLFFWGAALNVGMGAMTAAGLKQGADAAKQTEEQMEQAEAQSRAQVKALNRVAKAAEKNPEVARRTVQEMQREYAIPAGAVNFGKNALGYAKDMGKLAWSQKKKLGGYLASGATFGVLGYGADKWIQHDIKKNNLPLLPDQQNQQKPQQKVYAATGSIMNTASEYLNKGKKWAVDFGKKKWEHVKANPKSTIFGGALTVGLGAGMPLMSYAADKKQIKDQMAATQGYNSSPQQRSYAAVGSILSKRGKQVGDYVIKQKDNIVNFFKNKPGLKTLDKISSFSGGGGKVGRESMVDAIAKQGAESGNSWTKNTADFLKKHEKTAAGTTILGGTALMMGGFGQGEKLTKKAIGAVDKNAYAYEKSKEQQIQ